MSNILFKENIKEEFFLKISNPKFLMFQEYDESTENIFERGPLVVGFHEEEINYPGNVFVCSTTGRYYHDFLELFPRILTLKKFDNSLKVLIVVIQELLEDGYPAGLKKDHYQKKLSGQIFDQPCEYLIDFLNYFKIEYDFIHWSNLKNIKFENSYIFYMKNKKYKEVVEKDTKISYSSLEPKNLKFYKSVPFYATDTETWNSNDYINSSLIIKDNYPKFDVIKNKKIYISRKNFKDRNFKNEINIENFFKMHNYEIIFLEDLTILEQIKIVQESEKIVTIVGGSLSNFIFCNKNNKIIIFCPNGFEHSVIWDDLFSYYNISYIKKHFTLDDDIINYMLENEKFI